MRKENTKQSFREKVLATVKEIPKGKTCSYKEVAIRAGSPMAFRAVGNILNRNHDKKIPCHRVICSNGNAGGYNRGNKMKRRILAEEGVASF
ncbi:MAG: MGMT family protein [bacterium]|nr:MGMT family protein [bacterium]